MTLRRIIPKNKNDIAQLFFLKGMHFEKSGQSISSRSGFVYYPRHDVLGDGRAIHRRKKIYLDDIGSGFLHPGGRGEEERRTKVGPTGLRVKFPSGFGIPLSQSAII
jgi:hypothetical protein